MITENPAGFSFLTLTFLGIHFALMKPGLCSCLDGSNF